MTKFPVLWGQSDGMYAGNRSNLVILVLVTEEPSGFFVSGLPREIQRVKSPDASDTWASRQPPCYFRRSSY